MSKVITRIAEAAAIIGNVFGAMLVAGDWGTKYAIAGYSFFLIGSIASVWLLKHSTASRSLIFINLYFMGVNILGIATRVNGVH